MTIFDVKRARLETVRCEESLHFNNAGASKKPIAVRDAENHHLNLEDAIGAYEAARLPEQAESAENFYHASAKLLSCNPKEIAFIENATRAWDMAFYSIRFESGDRILMAEAEYASNAIASLHAFRHGRKYLRGPRGTGLLYVRESLIEHLEPPLKNVLRLKNQELM